MQRSLRWTGIQSRAIYVFSEEDGFLTGAALLEVEIEGRWQVQDPVHNVIYLDEAGQRLGAVDMVRRDIAHVTPTNARKSGWEATGTAHVRDLDSFAVIGVPQLRTVFRAPRAKGSRLIDLAVANFAPERYAVAVVE